jgi:spermidine synthase
MSVGGVLGGLFNALLAPLLFNSLAEYPLALVLAALLMPRLDDKKRRLSSFLDVAFLLVLALLSVEMFTQFPLSHKFLASPLGQKIFAQGPDTIKQWVESLAERTPLEANHLFLILTFAPPIVLCYFFVDRPVRFGLGLGILLLAGNLLWFFDGRVIYRQRSFFGLLTVQWDASPRHRGFDALFQYFFGSPENLEGMEITTGYTSLTHGHILHGMQNRHPNYRNVPLSYYHRTGPVGQLFAAFEGSQAKRQVAVIGLGTGTMACYPDAGHRLTFYEIDPKVKALSYDQGKYFSFVQDAQDRGAIIDIVLGDARLQLDRARKADSPEKYDVIVVDAFSSDAIPVHLLAREALKIYLDNLKEDGIVAFHTSNRYLALEPVVASLAADQGCVGLLQHDYGFSEKDYPGKNPSSWVLVARKEEHFGKLLEDVKENSEDKAKRWMRLEVDPRIQVWSDDFSNLLQVFRWDSSK